MIQPEPLKGQSSESHKERMPRGSAEPHSYLAQLRRECYPAAQGSATDEASGSALRSRTP